MPTFNESVDNSISFTDSGLGPIDANPSVSDTLTFGDSALGPKSTTQALSDSLTLSQADAGRTYLEELSNGFYFESLAGQLYTGVANNAITFSDDLKRVWFASNYITFQQTISAVVSKTGASSITFSQATGLTLTLNLGLVSTVTFSGTLLGYNGGQDLNDLTEYWSS